MAATTAPAPRLPRLRLGTVAPLAGLALVFVVGCWAAWSFTVDDAYITFRYSANLAAGHGPVWNVAGDPVEGFTNFGWMVWLAPFAALGLELAFVAKVTSFLLGAVVLVLLWLHANRAAGRGAALVATGAFVVFLPMYFHVTAGLESMAFAAVLLRVAIVGLNVVRGRPVRDWEPPLLLLVAGLLRPEGVLAALPVVGYWLWQARGRWVPRLWAGMAAAAGLAYFGWRWAFYGQLLPNTFYVKFGNLDAGYAWLEETVAVFAPLLLLTAVLVFRRGTRAAGLLLLATVAFTYGTYAVSGPTMDYVHRFAFHAFPVLCLGAGLGAAALDRRWLKVSAAALTVAWTGLAGLLHTGLPVVANYGHDLHRAHVPIGEGLAAAEVPAESRTLAVSDAGAIPYFSGWEAIDYIGLNDEAIAHGADPTAVVREANPTVIVVTAAGPRIPPVVYGMRVGEVTAGYVHVAQARMRENYWQHVFALPEWAPQVGTAVTTSVERAQRTYDPGRYGLTFDRWLDRLRGQLPGT